MKFTPNISTDPAGTLKDYTETYDCPIVISTALATNLVKKTVAKFLLNEHQVNMVNLESAIDDSKNI